MMEGSYSKVWNARSEAPAEEYKFFVESLMGTIRLVADSCGIQQGRLIFVHTGMRLLAVKKQLITVCPSMTP